MTAPWVSMGASRVVRPGSRRLLATLVSYCRPPLIMPRIPSVSPATGKPTPEYYIHTTSCNFVDVHGRTLLLRGVNLSGASKTPVGSQSQVLDNFWEDAENGNKGFIGRPLNLEDGSADVHLARLKGWGFNMLRYVVTWEALEHEGP